MNIWSKVITALQGGMAEAGEAIVDSQALRILDQEVRDAASELDQSKNALATIVAKQKVAQEKAKQLQSSITENEGYALLALDKKEDQLALEVAEKIASLETLRALEQGQAKELESSAKNLKSAIVQAEQNINRLKQQIDTVKATDSMQRAQAAVAEKYSGSSSKIRTAMDSLERIKERQALRSAQMSAESELASKESEDTLQNKLIKAGIISSGHNAQDILERIKNKAK